MAFRAVGFSAVLHIHDLAIRQHGGRSGIRDEGAIDAALQRPHSGFGDVELFPDLFGKAAALAHSIATTHPFVDGNKRTALAVAITALRFNGYELDATGEEEEDAVMSLVLGGMSLEGFAQWLREHSLPLCE